MAVVLATVLAAGIAMLPNSVQDAHAGQCNDDFYCSRLIHGRKWTRRWRTRRFRSSKISCDVTGLLIVNEITVIESEEVDPEFE